jgi:hypothetical protein
LAIVVAMVFMVARPLVLAVFSADILAMNPMVPVMRHMARNPDHLIVAVPIVLSMVVKRPVANLDLNATRSNSGRNKNARHQNGGEQKFAFYHPPTDHALIVLANTVLVARDTL